MRHEWEQFDTFEFGVRPNMVSKNPVGNTDTVESFHFLVPINSQDLKYSSVSQLVGC